MRIIELILDEGDVFGIDAISLVENPATREIFVAFKEEGKHDVKFAEVDKEQRILLGAVLIPNMPIYRNNEEYGEHYMFMSKDTVRESSERYLRQSVQHEVTLQHNEALEGCCVVETWIKEGEHDKTMNYGLNYPDGTWVASMKVSQEVYDAYVKTGLVKGFSIEAGYMDRMKVKNTEVSPDVDVFTELEAILKAHTNS